jgi:uncharacterized protein YhfF
VDERCKAFWDTFRAQYRDRDLPDTPTDVFAFGDSPHMADELGALVVAGVKTATTSALWAYEPGEAMPEVGHLSIVLDGSGAPLCVIETTEVRQLPFADVDAVFAYDEGEGDRSLAYWREAHERFFSRTLPKLGKAFDETMPVVCERFRVIWPKPHNP